MEVAADPVNGNPLKTSPTNILNNKLPEIAQADGLTYGCMPE